MASDSIHSSSNSSSINPPSAHFSSAHFSSAHFSSAHFSESLDISLDISLLPTTPFPNRLLDTVMPTLTDTQWRLLCVIVRQTLGWKQGKLKQRKAFDWLSQSQLQARTGRSPASLSRATDALVRRGLIQVWSDQGRLLLSPQERRRSSGRLFFRLSPRLLDQLQQHRGSRLSAASVPTSDSASASLLKRKEQNVKKQERTVKSEIAKVNTTKETATKYLSNDRERRNRSPSFNKKFSTRLAAKQKTTDPPNPEVKRFLSTYRTLFRQHTARGEPPVINWGKDGKLVKQLLRLYSYERLVNLLERFFKSDDPWIRKTGYSLSAFKGIIGSLLINENRIARSSLSPPVIMHTGSWTKAGDLSAAHRRGSE